MDRREPVFESAQVKQDTDRPTRRQILKTGAALVTSGAVCGWGRNGFAADTVPKGSEPCIDVPTTTGAVPADAPDGVPPAAAPGEAVAPIAQVLRAGRFAVPPEVQAFVPKDASGESKPAQFAALNRWSDRKVLRVRFVGGGDRQMKSLVAEIIEKGWMPHANLDFKFDSRDREAEIRIRFSLKGGGHWSYVGLTVFEAVLGPDDPTMNLSVNSLTALSQPYNRGVVLHEFGHALGLVHEHSSSKSPIKFNEDLVKAYFKTNHGWSDDDVERNVLKRYRASELTKFVSEFDPKSIMIYQILPEWTENNVGTEVNSVLSETDISFIKQLYPGRDGGGGGGSGGGTEQTLTLNGAAVKSSVGSNAKSTFKLQLGTAQQVTFRTAGRTQVTFEVVDSKGNVVKPGTDHSVTPDLINEAQYFPSLPADTYQVNVKHLKGVDRGNLEFTIEALAGDKRSDYKFYLDSKNR